MVGAASSCLASLFRQGTEDGTTELTGLLRETDKIKEICPPNTRKFLGEEDQARVTSLVGSLAACCGVEGSSDKTHVSAGGDVAEGKFMSALQASYVALSHPSRRVPAITVDCQKRSDVERLGEQVGRVMIFKG